MIAPKTAEKVWRGTPSQSAQVPYSRDSSTMVSPTSKNTLVITRRLCLVLPSGSTCTASRAARRAGADPSAAPGTTRCGKPCRSDSLMGVLGDLHPGRSVSGSAVSQGEMSERVVQDFSVIFGRESVPLDTGTG